MAHGAGGKATQSLIEGLLVPALGTGEGTLEALADAGVVTIDGLGLALTTDSYVVRPIRFPGGSIGELAVNGTVNDLAAAGARPLALTVSLVLEEGLEADVLRGEVEAIAAAARAASVEVVAGDTKVVERGHADDMYICTAGLGLLHQRAALSPARLAPGGSAPGGRRCPPPVWRRGTGSCCRGPSATTERPSCSLGGSSSSMRQSRPTRGPCGPSSTHSWRRPGPRCTAFATRRGEASRPCSTSWRAPRASRCSCARRRCRWRRRWRAPPRSSASTRCTWRT